MCLTLFYTSMTFQLLYNIDKNYKLWAMVLICLHLAVISSSLQYWTSIPSIRVLVQPFLLQVLGTQLLWLWESWLNPFPNKPWFLHVCNRSLLKTLWEKKKLLVTSNFSFSHSVFYPFWQLCAIFSKSEIVVCKLFRIGRVHNLSPGKGLKMSCP